MEKITISFTREGNEYGNSVNYEDTSFNEALEELVNFTKGMFHTKFGERK